MAVNFTDSPSNGDTLTAGGRTYTYNSSTSTWDVSALTTLNPVVTATASGAIANGDMIIINSDGTVSAVAGSTTSAGVGSATVFESASTSYTAATFDSNSGKVVIAYEDVGNSQYGTAVVGTVSGNSISFGTPVVFESAEVSYVTATFDSYSNKVVIFYRDHGNSNRGTAVVGTVSGTSISFGTPVSVANHNSTDHAITFDSTNNKVIVAYRNNTTSSRGTAVVGTVSGTDISFGTPVTYYSGINLRTALGFDSSNGKVIVAYRAHSNSGRGRAQVGTVSGTSISFGSSVDFNTSSTLEYTNVVFDSSNNKVVILYHDDGNSNRGTAIVGTVSGTSISFGSEVVFNTTETNYISGHFDSNANKVIIAYQDAGNSNYGQAIAGTVSDTSISFDTEITFESANSAYIGSTFDTSANKSVFSYVDGGNSSYGTAIVGQLTSSSSTNLTATNYIGVADGTYSNSATATVQLIGSVDDAQSGLTAGQSYYIQNDGTLSTSAGSPSVLAGTAISATRLIVKSEIVAAAAAGLLLSGGRGVTTYPNVASLTSSGNTGGDLAFVTDVKAFYGWDGTEWDRIFSGQNTLPEFTTSPASSYNLALDGTATTVTVAATDPEGFTVTYSHDTTPADQAQATITQNGGTFTVTPSTSTSNGGTFTARFKAFDGVRTNSASATFSLLFYEYVNWTTTNSYYNSGSGWQLNDNGNNIEVYNAGNLGTLSATHTTYTIADSQSGLSKVYFEFTTNSSQAYYAAGFISTAKINSDNHLRDVTTNTTGHYGGEFSASGGNTYSFMLDRNTKKLHYWKNGTYDSTRSRALANGTYYAAIGDGASSNTASSSTKSIIRGINSNGTATFTYNPDTLWNNLTSAQQGP